MTRKELIERAEMFKISIDEAIRMRLIYLNGEKRRLVNEKNTLLDEAIFCSSNEVTEKFVMLYVDKVREEIKKINREVKALTTKPKKGEVTEDMIQEARDYPIENLLEFRNGRCKAFCHESDSDSMAKSRKSNTVFCHVCGKSHNPIDVVMAVQGLTFLDAVKVLVGHQA